MVEDYQVSIVLVDDDEDDRNFFTRAVHNTSPAIRFVALGDGEKFMEFLENDPVPRPDLVILDINMPGLSGLDCLKQLRQSSGWSDLPVVMYSTSTQEKDLNDSTQLGANLYVVKPKEISALYRLVNYLVNLDWSRRKPFAQNILFKDPSIS